MANWYVYSGAGGAGTGADWTNAYTTLGAAMAAKAAGDTFFVASTHSESAGATKTITSPGTEASPCRVYSVDAGGSVPPVYADLQAGATIQTTANFGITVAGTIAEIFGVNFRCGSSTSTQPLNINSTTARTMKLVACTLKLLGTGAAARINLGTVGGSTSLEDCTVEFTSVSQSIVPIGKVTIRCLADFVVGSTIPTILFSPGTAATKLYVEAGSFNDISSTKSLILATTATASTAIFKNCPMDTTTGSLISGSIPGRGGLELHLIRTAADDYLTYGYQKYNYDGAMVIMSEFVRQGGAHDGVQPVAWMISATRETWPFECPPIQVWNETTGSAITVTIEATGDNLTIPDNNEIWMEVYYLGTSGSPLALMATSGRTTMLHTGTTYDAGDGGWDDDTGCFQMSVSITPQEKGPITIYVKAISTVPHWYVDPKPVIS